MIFSKIIFQSVMKSVDNCVDSTDDNSLAHISPTYQTPYFIFFNNKIVNLGSNFFTNSDYIRNGCNGTNRSGIGILHENSIIYPKRLVLDGV